MCFPLSQKQVVVSCYPWALEPHLAYKQGFPFIRRGGLCITNTLMLLHKSLLGGSHFSPWHEWCTNRDGRGPARESLFEDIWSRQYSFSVLFIVEQSSPPPQGFLLESLWAENDPAVSSQADSLKSCRASLKGQTLSSPRMVVPSLSRHSELLSDTHPLLLP